MLFLFTLVNYRYGVGLDPQQVVTAQTVPPIAEGKAGDAMREVIERFLEAANQQQPAVGAQPPREARATEKNTAQQE